jgi:hypothetical protein
MAGGERAVIVSGCGAGGNGSWGINQCFPRCFLRKMVSNIDNELSYDIFINMINSIKFKEGTIPASKKD